MTTTTTTASPELRKRVEKLRSLPSSPAVLQPLLDLLRRPPDEIELSQVVQLVSYEKTIAAQLLRIVNSPLYARARPAESIQSAIFTLGIQRIEDILLSNCFGNLVPKDKWVVDPAVFWRHSFGCALVCREFAERIDYYDPDKAYLAGLLHDLGIIVNSLATLTSTTPCWLRPCRAVALWTSRKRKPSASRIARVASSSVKPGSFLTQFAESSGGTTTSNMLRRETR